MDAISIAEQTSPARGEDNRAPKCKWRGGIEACGARRQRLFVDEQETPFFINSAMGILAHRTQGDEHGLFGSGMGPVSSYHGLRCALMLGSGRNVAALKHRAEQMAMAYSASVSVAIGQ